MVVPTEAVIQTGTRSVVIVANGDGRFVPVDVRIGGESKGQTEIRQGLDIGQTVVVSGQFLIDSDANLKAAASRMSGAPAASSATPVHRGTGKVESITREAVVLSHGPISTLRWGAMTMGFKPPAAGVPQGIAIGDTVAFAIRAAQDGSFEIVSMTPIISSPATMGPGAQNQAPPRNGDRGADK